MPQHRSLLLAHSTEQDSRIHNWFATCTFDVRSLIMPTPLTACESPNGCSGKAESHRPSDK